MNLHKWANSCSKEARNIVLSVLRQETTKPLTIHQLYRLTVQQEAARLGKKLITDESSQLRTTTYPPHSDHVIRSLNFLKNEILPHMAGQKYVQKVRSTRALTEEEMEQRKHESSRRGSRQNTVLSDTANVWLWKLRDRTPPPAPKPAPPVFGTEVGVGEDWLHLNKRRRRVREDKVQSDVKWLQQIEAARKEGIRLAQEEAAKLQGAPSAA